MTALIPWGVGLVAFLWMFFKGVNKDGGVDAGSAGEAIFASFLAAAVAVTATIFVLAMFGINA